MRLPVLIRRDAEEDLTEAFRWYEERREGLGGEFLLCIDAVLESISRHPSFYSVVHRQVHRALVRRFPYGVFYLTEDNRVVVVAVMHAKRAPSKWKDRV